MRAQGWGYKKKCNGTFGSELVWESWYQNRLDSRTCWLWNTFTIMVVTREVALQRTTRREAARSSGRSRRAGKRSGRARGHGKTASKKNRRRAAKRADEDEGTQRDHGRRGRRIRPGHKGRRRRHYSVSSRFTMSILFFAIWYFWYLLFCLSLVAEVHAIDTVAGAGRSRSTTDDTPDDTDVTEGEGGGIDDEGFDDTEGDERVDDTDEGDEGPSREGSGDTSATILPAVDPRAIDTDVDAGGSRSTTEGDEGHQRDGIPAMLDEPSRFDPLDSEWFQMHSQKRPWTPGIARPRTIRSSAIPGYIMIEWYNQVSLHWGPTNNPSQEVNSQFRTITRLFRCHYVIMCLASLSLCHNVSCFVVTMS